MVSGTRTHLGVCVKGDEVKRGPEVRRRDEVRRGFLGESMKRRKVQVLFDHL